MADDVVANFELASRAPYGARGLKCDLADDMYLVNKVAPRMGRVD